jgi:uncharacterized protein YbaP (TraB family)
MTPEQIRAAIAARPELAGVTDSQALADALSAGRTKVVPKMVSARGLAEHLGAIPAEIVLMKLEGARDAMLASADQQQKVLGSLLRRQLAFLNTDGLDFGSAALRSMLDQFGALGVLTAAEVTALKAIALEPDPLSELAVRSAIWADDGTLLIGT